MASETPQDERNASSQSLSASLESPHDDPVFVRTESVSSSHGTIVLHHQNSKDFEEPNKQNTVTFRDGDGQGNSDSDTITSAPSRTASVCSMGKADKHVSIKEEAVSSPSGNHELPVYPQLPSFASPSASLTRLALPQDDETKEDPFDCVSPTKGGAGIPHSRSVTSTSTANNSSKAFDKSEIFSPSVYSSPKNIWSPRRHWFSIVLILLSIFSTLGSGLFLGVALRKPTFSFIHSGSGLSISDATFLTTFIAKLIELSFTTVFVSFIGQAISRRAFKKDHGRGITLAEICMRQWIIDPGSIISHMETFKVVIFSILGILAMTAAWCGMLYTTASSALVSPQLRFGDREAFTMSGLVKASAFNAPNMELTCQTPIPYNRDPSEGASVCLEIKNAAQSYYNYYETYLRKWAALPKNETSDSRPSHRIPAQALLNEDTTVTAAWLDEHDIASESRRAGRIINNVTLVMPHAGVYNAAMDPVNNILTPEGSKGLGSFALEASVPSPVLYVMCANVSHEEMSPMIYTEWPHAKRVNVSSWPDQISDTADWTNKTALDDLYGWNKVDPQGTTLIPPIFARFPEDYNTILNDTSNWGVHDAIYLLAKAAPEFGGFYNLCSIRAGYTPLCSTQYNTTSSGGTMGVDCSETGNPLRYLNSVPDSPTGNPGVTLNYPPVASQWGRAVALNTGINTGNAANPRILTELVLTEPELPPHKPSLAEALAVMAGNTLLMSVQHTPFVTYWNYSATVFTLDPGTYQFFNASIQTQRYAAGGSFSYQKGFYVILVLAFLLNIVALVWLLAQNGVVTDFCELPNLFALSMNSPPSEKLEGSSTGGPVKEQYKVRWFVNLDGDDIFLDDGTTPRHRDPRPRRAFTSMSTATARSTIAETYSELSRGKSWL